MTIRSRILEWARGEVGPGDRAAYWRSAYGSDPGKNLAWCGAFCLAALHQAGVALDTHWVIGKGFIGPLGLKQTKTPSRGDIGYIHEPYQHHFLFDYEHEGYVYSIDGNQPDVRAKKRPRQGIVFYSIEPLLACLPEPDAEPDPTEPTPAEEL